MKEIKGAILSQNHWRSQGGDPGGPGLTTRYFDFALNASFFMKEIKGAILSQNYWHSQGGDPGGPGPLN